MSNLSLEKCTDHPRADLWRKGLQSLVLDGGARMLLSARCGRTSEVILALDVVHDSISPACFIAAQDTWTPTQLASSLVVMCEQYFDGYRTKRPRRLDDGTQTRSPKEIHFVLQVIPISDGDDGDKAALVANMRLPHPDVYVQAEPREPGEMLTRDELQSRYIERVEGQLSVTTNYLMRAMETLPRVIDSMERAAAAQQSVMESSMAKMADTYAAMGKLQADALQTSAEAEAKLMRADGDSSQHFLDTPSGSLIGEMLADAGVRLLGRTEDQWADLAAKVFTRVQEMTGKVKS